MALKYDIHTFNRHVNCHMDSNMTVMLSKKFCGSNGKFTCAVFD